MSWTREWRGHRAGPGVIHELLYERQEGRCRMPTLHVAGWYIGQRQGLRVEEVRPAGVLSSDLIVRVLYTEVVDLRTLPAWVELPCSFLDNVVGALLGSENNLYELKGFRFAGAVDPASPAGAQRVREAERTTTEMVKRATTDPPLVQAAVGARDTARQFQPFALPALLVLVLGAAAILILSRVPR